jgi:hypothetical protein
MTHEIIAFSEANHPGRHRSRVGLMALFFGLFAAPIAWAGNLMVTYALATHACYPAGEPLSALAAGFGFAWPLILACYLIALALCLAAGLVSFRNWRATGREVGGGFHHLIEKGEGRTRYLSIIGMAYSILFFAAVLFGAIVLAIVPLCEH